MSSSDAKYIAPCGGDCRQCKISQFSVSRHVADLRRPLESLADCARGLGWPLMRDLAGKSAEDLKAIVERCSQTLLQHFPTCCREGCVPRCDVRDCLKSKNLDRCADCGESPSCSTLQRLRKKMEKKES